MITVAATMQPSSRRPVPLIGRNDLTVSYVRYRGIINYVVKDPVGLKYHRLRAEQFRLLELLDGRRTLENLRETLIHEFPTIRPTLRELQQLAADLHQKGLAYSDRAGQAETRQQQQTKQRRQQFKRRARVAQAQRRHRVALGGNELARRDLLHAGDLRERLTGADHRGRVGHADQAHRVASDG